MIFTTILSSFGLFNKIKNIKCGYQQPYSVLNNQGSDGDVLRSGLGSMQYSRKSSQPLSTSRSSSSRSSSSSSSSRSGSSYGSRSSSSRRSGSSYGYGSSYGSSSGGYYGSSASLPPRRFYGPSGPSFLTPDLSNKNLLVSSGYSSNNSELIDPNNVQVQAKN